jgi:hypothetical protein
MRLSAYDEGDAWEVEKRLEWEGSFNLSQDRAP